MKKRLHKLFGMFMLVVLMLSTLTGCSAGSTIETTLAINEDLSGTRTMKVVIADSVFAENFTGTIEDLKNVVQTKCPSDLAWTYDESTGAKTFTFTMNFTSPEDYDAKVKNLILAGDESGTKTFAEDYRALELYAPDSVWAKGFYLDEDFDSEDLLKWLENAIISGGMVSSGNRSNIFSNGTTTITYAGQSYSSSGDARVNAIEYVEFEGFNIYTTVKGMDSFDRTIALVIPATSMSSSGAEIESFVAQYLPEGATAEWTMDEDGNSVYCVTATDLTLEGLNDFMKAYFGTENTVVEVTDYNTTSPFYLAKTMLETYDLHNFYLEGANFTPRCKFYAKYENEYDGDMYGDVDENGYYLNISKKINHTILDDIESNYYKDFAVRKLDVETKVGANGKFVRTFLFELDRVPTETELEQIDKKIENLLAQQLVYEAQVALETELEALEEEGAATEVLPEEETVETTDETEEVEEVIDFKKEFNVDYSGKVKKDVFTYTLKQSGDSAEIARSSLALFGEEGSIEYTSNFGILKLKYDVGYHEDIYYGRFSNSIAATAEVKHITVLPTGTKIAYPRSYDGYAIKGNTITKPDASAYLYITVTGDCTNYWAIAIYGLILAGVVLMVIGANKSGLMDGAKAKAAEKAQATAAARAAAQAAKTNAATCKNCGAVLPKGALFCGSCGTKVEE